MRCPREKSTFVTNSPPINRASSAPAAQASFSSTANSKPKANLSTRCRSASPHTKAWISGRTTASGRAEIRICESAAEIFQRYDRKSRIRSRPGETQRPRSAADLSRTVRHRSAQLIYGTRRYDGLFISSIISVLICCSSFRLLFELNDYGDDTNWPEARTRAQTARSGPVQSGRRPGTQASCDNGEIRSRVVADVVDRRRLLLHPARIGRDRVVIAVSERGRHLFLDETRVG